MSRLTGAARDEAARYNRGLSTADSLMALRASDLRSMVAAMRGKPRCPRTKGEMSALLLSRMPRPREALRVVFSEPSPVGALEIKSRADAAVRNWRKRHDD